MSNPQQSYQAFLQENLTDRTKQRAYFDQVRGTDTRFQGLDEATQANILADVSGFEPFRRFAQGNIAKGLDAFGNFTQQAATDFRPGDVTRIPSAMGQLISGGSEQPLMSPGMEKPVSAYTGDVGYAAAKGLGAGESTAGAFRTGAEQIPNVVSQLGTAFIPGVGLPAMMASMYGQGLDQAYSQGETGAKAHVVASVGPLASAVTMGLARPLSGWAANKVLSVGASQAIKDGMKLGGEVGLKAVLADKAVSAGTKIAMKAGQEFLVEGAQAGIGVVADVTQNAILDPEKFFTETIKDKNYWIPMLMSEVIEGAGGTILGRMRKPLETAPERMETEEADATPEAVVGVDGTPVTPIEGAAAVDPANLAAGNKAGANNIGREATHNPDGSRRNDRQDSKAAVAAKAKQTALPDLMSPPAENIANPAFDPKKPDSDENKPTITNPEWEAFQKDIDRPLFSVKAKEAADVDPAAADSDHQLVEAEKADVQVASGVLLNTVVKAKSATVNAEFDSSQPVSETNQPIIPASEPVYVHDFTHAIDNVARNVAAKGELDLHENPAETAGNIIANAVKDAPAGVEPHQAISSIMEISTEIGGQMMKDHHLETGDNGYIALRNPGTKEHGVLLHFVRDGVTMNKGSEAAASKLIIRPGDLLTLDPVNGRAELDARSKMAEPMSEGEWARISELAAATQAHYANIPFGVSFGDGHDPAYVRGMTDYLQRSGIQEALVVAGKKLRFGIEARKVSKDTLANASLDYFSAMNKAQNVVTGDLSYISRNDGFDASTDVHELGHTVGDLVSQGHFGPEVATEWNAFLEQASKFVDDGKIAREGAKIQNKLTGRSLDDGNVERTRQYLLGKPGEDGTPQTDVTAEISAQTFQGYFMGKSNPFSAWVEKTFPALHKMFKRLMLSFNVTGNPALTAQKQNLYSPEFQQGRQILEGLFESKYRQSENVAKELKALVGKHKLTGKAVDAVTSAWYSSTRPQAHQAIKDAVKIWSEGNLEKGKPLGSEISDLADSMAQLAHFNQVNMRGHMPAGEALLGMPWMRKLAGRNLEKIHMAIQGKIEDPKLMANLNRVFLTKEEQDFIRDNSTNITDPTALKRASTLARNRELLLLNVQNVTKAIDELLAASGENRVTGNQVVKQMFQLDNVVKKWMLGKLEGQNGVPFADDNNKIFATELTPKALEQAGKSHTFYRWFPILSKSIRKAVTKSKVIPETYVAADGSVTFAKDRVANAKRLSFDNASDASDYVETRNMEPNSKVRFKVKKGTSKAGEKHFIVAREAELDSRYVDEMWSDSQWQDDLQQLVRPAPMPETGVDYMTPEEIAMRAEDALESARKSAFVKEHGPEVSRKLKDIVPSAIKFYDSQGLLNDGITQKQLKFDAWLKKSPANRKLLSKLAEQLGVPKDSDAITVSTAWIRLHLDEGKTQQKNDAILGLNWLNPKLDGKESGLFDYIMSMHNYAKAYAKAREGKARSEMLNPKVRGAVPEISPSEFGGHARLAGTDVLNNPDVVSGTAAAIIGQPGGFQGRKATVEQIKPILKNIMGRPLGVVQEIHLLFGAGPIHTALTKIVGKPLADAIFLEVGRATAWVEEAAESMFNKGELKEDINGEWMFIKNERLERDDASAFHKIGRGSKLKEEHQLINWLEQEASMPFERLLKQSELKMLDRNGKEVDASPLIKRAHEIAKSLTPETLAIHREALARRYAAQKDKVRREVEADQFAQVASFAVALKTNDAFNNSSAAAHAFAQRFAELPTEQKVLSLVNDINLTPEESMDTVERYEKVTDKLMKKHQFMYDNLQYITETRMKDFHVGLVYAKQKDGTVPTPGYYDFDTAAEAEAFRQEQIKLGNKPGKIKDFARQRWNYKPLSGSLGDIIERVTNQKRDLVETVLYQRLDPETQNLVSSILSHTAEDIQTENDVVLASKNDLVKRKFVGGRENLDMTDQFNKSTQRRAAAMSRKRTDLIFKLYEQDEALMQEKGLFQIMDHFRKGVRMKDTEFQKNVGKAGFIAYIMTNVSSALIEIFQFPITLSPILMENGASTMDAYRIPARMMRYATKAALARLAQKSDADIWDQPEHASLLREAERQGRGNQKRNLDYDEDKSRALTDRYDDITGEQGVKKGALHVAGLTYKFFNNLYGFFNKINADLSLVSAYEVLKKTQYGNKPLNETQTKELQNQAMMMADIANGSLQRLGRPAFMHNERAGIRNASSMYWSLQSFVNAQVANQLRFMQKSVNMGEKFTKAESVQARKAMVGLLGAQFTGMGIMGFTLMPAMAKLVQQTFGFDLEDELRELLYNDEGKTASEKTFLGEVAMNGLLSAIGSPIDYGTRMSVGGVNVFSAYEGIDANQLGGPLIGLAANAFKDLEKVKAGNMSLGEGAINLLPMGLRRGVRMSFFDDGSVYDSNKRFMFQASAVEQAGSWLGFATTRQKKVMKYRMESDEAMKGDTSEKSNLANQVLMAQKESPFRVQALLNQGAQQFGMKPYDFASYVANKQVDKQMGPDPREGAGPESVIAKKLYPSPLGNQSQEGRQNAVYDSISKLGMTPRVSRTAINNARQQDYMMRLDPTMTTGTASRRVRENPQQRQGFASLLGYE